MSHLPPGVLLAFVCWFILTGIRGSFAVLYPTISAEPGWSDRELAGTFSVADMLMADVLRLVDRFDRLAGHPACRAYVARATARPSFVKAHADQMAHFAAAD